MSEIAELYAEGTALAWEAKVRQETRDEEKAERAVKTRLLILMGLRK